MLLSPGRTYGATETVRVEFADRTVDERETIVGVSDAVILGLLEDAERLMKPEKMPKDLTVIVELADEPPAMVRLVGIAEMTKLGGCTSTAKSVS